MRFIAMARVSCASLLIEPNDIAPVVKRFTISLAGSTSAIGTGLSLFFNFIKLRNVDKLLLWLSIRSVYSWKVCALSCRTACCNLLMVSSSDRKLSLGLGQRTEGVLVLQLSFAGEHFEANSFQARRRACEVRIHQLF